MALTLFEPMNGGYDFGNAPSPVLLLQNLPLVDMQRTFNELNINGDGHITGPALRAWMKKNGKDGG